MEIDEALAPSGDPRVVSGASVGALPTGWPRALPWALLAGALVVLAAVLALWAPWGTPSPTAAIRVTADLGADTTLVTDQGAAAVLSPDGGLFVFAGQKSGASNSQLFVRRLDQLLATPLTAQRARGIRSSHLTANGWGSLPVGS